jgi:CHAT domain-containing protein
MKTCLFVLFVCFPSILFAQFPKVPGSIGGISTSTITKTTKSLLINQLDKSKEEYDTTSFNYAISLSDNAGLYENEERWLRNQKLFSDVLKQSNGTTLTPKERAEQDNEVGEMMYASNKFTSAENAFFAAKLTYETNGLTSETGYGKVIANLALLYHTTGRYIKSEELNKLAIAMRKTQSGESSVAYAASINNMGVLYKDMGKYTEAESYLNQAIKLNSANPGKQSAAYAITLNNQAMLFEEMGRFSQADKLLSEAIIIAAEVMTEKSTNYQRLLINQALLYQGMGDYNKADAIYSKAISIKEKRLGTSHPDYAHLLNLQAELYMLMKKTTEVESLLKKSASIYLKKFGSSHPSYAGVLHNLGNYYRIQNQQSPAYSNLNQALLIRKQALGDSHPDALQTTESIALLDWQAKKYSAAAAGFHTVLDQDMLLIHEYFAALSEAEKARFWDKMHPHFDHYASFVVDAHSTLPELTGQLFSYQLSTKALLLNASNKIRQQILSSGDAILIKEYQEWLDSKEYLSRLYGMSKSDITEQKINLDSIENATNAKEKNLSSKSNIFKSGYATTATTWQNVQAVLGIDDAVVDIVHIKKFNRELTDTIYYGALVLTKEMLLPQFVILKNGNQLEKRNLAYYRNAIKNKITDYVSYSQYWQEIDNATGTKKNVYVSIDGIYSQINIATLRLSDGSYLFDKKNYLLVSNSKDIIKLKTTTPKSTTLSATLIGNPIFGNTGTISPLPGTKIELETIKVLLTSKGYKVTNYVQAEATEQNIRKVSNPKILHIATHGFFIKEALGEEKTMGIETEHSALNPMLRSGLLLANAEAAMAGQSEYGVLTAYEVMNLNLDQTEIVVMSACETGLGDVKNGEGVYGLQRAFLVAGADALIMSLWKVSDEATQKLMTSFYKNYLLLNNKEKAFKAAQNELKILYKDPYYWGAFVLVQ